MMCFFQHTNNFNNFIFLKKTYFLSCQGRTPKFDIFLNKNSKLIQLNNPNLGRFFYICKKIIK